MLETHLLTARYMHQDVLLHMLIPNYNKQELMYNQCFLFTLTTSKLHLIYSRTYDGNIR